MISLSDANLLLSRLKDDSLAIRFTFSGNGISFGFDGFIGAFLPGDKIVIFPADPNVARCEALVELSNAQFEYGDIREAAADLPDTYKSKYQSVLVAVLTSGER